MQDKVAGIISRIVLIENEMIQNMNDNISLDTIGFNSIKFMQLIVLLEESFDFEADENDILVENIDTKEKVYALINKYK